VAEINDETFGGNPKSKGKMETFLKEFLKDDRAVLDLYKLWLLSDLKTEEHYDAIARNFSVRNEDDILKSVLQRCPSTTQKYFQKVLESKDEGMFPELESFFENFDMLNLDKVNFDEVD
jgi:hypothetical protein